MSAILNFVFFVWRCAEKSGMKSIRPIRQKMPHTSCIHCDVFRVVFRESQIKRLQRCANNTVQCTRDSLYIGAQHYSMLLFNGIADCRVVFASLLLSFKSTITTPTTIQRTIEKMQFFYICK